MLLCRYDGSVHVDLALPGATVMNGSSQHQGQLRCPVLQDFGKFVDAGITTFDAAGESNKDSWAMQPPVHSSRNNTAWRSDVAIKGKLFQ